MKPEPRFHCKRCNRILPLWKGIFKPSEVEGISSGPTIEIICEDCYADGKYKR